jgi:hypothetical protein
MRQKSNSTPASSETLVRNIRRATRKHHAADEKINRRTLPTRRNRGLHRFAAAAAGPQAAAEGE